jgi:hypothetical protein
MKANVIFISNDPMNDKGKSNYNEKVVSMFTPKDGPKININYSIYHWAKSDLKSIKDESGKIKGIHSLIYLIFTEDFGGLDYIKKINKITNIITQYSKSNITLIGFRMVENGKTRRISLKNKRIEFWEWNSENLEGALGHILTSASNVLACPNLIG